MYAVLKSFGLKGLNGFPVEVEADISGGMPALSIVGLPDSAVRESGDRVHAALKNLGFLFLCIVAQLSFDTESVL